MVCNLRCAALHIRYSEETGRGVQDRPRECLGINELVNREGLTSIEDVSLVDSSHHCLLPVTLVDLHQACPRGVVASFPAYPEYVHIHF